MDSIRDKAGIVSVLLLTILNALAGFGIVPPQGFDAQGVALLNSAVLAVGALVVHLLKPAAPVPAPTDPAA
jgi:hypothetical protein